MSNLRASSILLALVLLAGCSQKTPEALPVAVAKPPAVDPERVLYDQLRSGSFQLSAAQEDLSNAAEIAQSLASTAGGTAAKGFKDLLAKVNEAGAKLGDYTGAPESFEQFSKDVNSADDRRLNAIAAATDAMDAVSDGQDIADALLAAAPDSAKPNVQKIQDELDDAIDALTQGVHAMGGKVEDDDTHAPGTLPST